MISVCCYFFLDPILIFYFKIEVLKKGGYLNDFGQFELISV